VPEVDPARHPGRAGRSAPPTRCAALVAHLAEPLPLEVALDGPAEPVGVAGEPRSATARRGPTHVVGARRRAPGRRRGARPPPGGWRPATGRPPRRSRRAPPRRAGWPVRAATGAGRSRPPVRTRRRRRPRAREGGRRAHGHRTLRARSEIYRQRRSMGHGRTGPPVVATAPGRAHGRAGQVAALGEQRERPGEERRHLVPGDGERRAERAVGAPAGEAGGGGPVDGSLVHAAGIVGEPAAAVVRTSPDARSWARSRKLPSARG
jgi:hypothetical protein